MQNVDQFVSIIHESNIATRVIVTNFGFNMIGYIFDCLLIMQVIYFTIYI